MSVPFFPLNILSLNSRQDFRPEQLSLLAFPSCRNYGIPIIHTKSIVRRKIPLPRKSGSDSLPPSSLLSLKLHMAISTGREGKYTKFSEYSILTSHDKIAKPLGFSSTNLVDVVLSDRQSPYLWLLIKNLISAKNCLPLCLCLWPWDDGSLLWAVSVVEVHCGVSVVCVAWALI